MRNSILLLTVFLFPLACTSAGRVESSAMPLGLKVTVEGSPHPVATIHVTNNSNRSIAWSPTFGFSDLYLYLEIRSDFDETIPYPAESQYELFSEPKHHCLKPREPETVRVDLLSWYHLLGGKLSRETVADTGPYEFNLIKGQYQIRARYTPPVPRSGRCHAAAAKSQSEWVAFSVGHR